VNVYQLSIIPVVYISFFFSIQLHFLFKVSSSHNLYIFSFQYVNDLEKDSKYNTWPNNVQDLLRPTFPGMLRHVAKNIFHLVSNTCVKQSKTFLPKLLHLGHLRLNKILGLKIRSSKPGTFLNSMIHCMFQILMQLLCNTFFHRQMFAIKSTIDIS
jgi:hypothetical protein